VSKLDVWMNSCGGSAAGVAQRTPFDPDNPGGEYSLDLGSGYDAAVASELAQMARNRPENVTWHDVTYVLRLCVRPVTGNPHSRLVRNRYNMQDVSDWDLRTWIYAGLPTEGILAFTIKYIRRSPTKNYVLQQAVMTNLMQQMVMQKVKRKKMTLFDLVGMTLAAKVSTAQPAA